MENNNRTPDDERERLRRKELENNPTGALNEGFKRAYNGNLEDLTGGMGWKGTLGTIVVLVVGYVVYRLFFA